MVADIRLTEPADKNRPKYPPEPTPQTTRNVPEDYPSVMAAYQDAPPGTTISVGSGVNCGDLNLSRDLDPNNPIILRSRDRLGALLDNQVKLAGKGHWLHGFKQTFKVTSKGDGGIVVAADFITLTKMEIQSPHGITSSEPKRADVRIGWCYFSGKNANTSAISNIFFKIPNGGQYSRSSDGPCRIYIYNNDFDDDGSRPSGVPMEDHCIYFGDSKPKGDDVVCMEDVELDHNLIRDSNKRVRGFYMKRGAYLFQNSLLGARHNWGIRHGGNARIEANIAKGSAKLVLNGKGHKLYNNSWEKQCDLYAGASKNGRGPLYQAASDAELDMNEGPVNLGYIASTHQLDSSQGGKLDHCTIWRHIGTVDEVAANIDSSAFNIRDQPRVGASYLERVLLTPADVGMAG